MKKFWRSFLRVLAGFIFAVLGATAILGFLVLLLHFGGPLVLLATGFVFLFGILWAVALEEEET